MWDGEFCVGWCDGALNYRQVSLRGEKAYTRPLASRLAAEQLFFVIDSPCTGSSNEIGDAGAAALSGALGRLGNLQELYL